MRDSIDLAAVLAALNSVGLGLADAQAKAGWSISLPKPKLRRTARYVASATPCSTIPMLARRAMPAPRSAAWSRGLSGTGAVYVSGGAEHQGPPGGGPVAVIARA